jgi:gluconate kinase
MVGTEVVSMLVKVFVMGRPGCGKTTAVHHILESVKQRGYEARRSKDYDLLYKWFLEDQERTDSHRFREIEYKGFDILDISLLDKALEELEKGARQEIAAVEEPGIIVIEFARNNYRTALRNFTPEFLKNSYFFFVDADLHSCMQRIHQRVIDFPKPDCHFVSDWIMETYYKDGRDDWSYVSDELWLQYGLPREAIKLYYNMGTVSQLLECATDFVNGILEKEFSNIDEENKLPDQLLCP